MLQTCVRSGSTAAVPANAATTGEHSPDEILVERIAAGDKLAMEVLFARHRTNLYRWLLALSARRRGTDAELDETIEATVADSADDPEITLQKKSRNELLRQATSTLSTDHREILDLVYYQEKSIENCALILGIPAATVKTRMFYARKKLAELVVEA